MPQFPYLPDQWCTGEHEVLHQDEEEEERLDEEGGVLLDSVARHVDALLLLVVPLLLNGHDPHVDQGRREDVHHSHEPSQDT